MITMQSKIIRLVQDTLKENAAERPDKVALICEDRRLTYSQIDAMSKIKRWKCTKYCAW